MNLITTRPSRTTSKKDSNIIQKYLCTVFNQTFATYHSNWLNLNTKECVMLMFDAH